MAFTADDTEYTIFTGPLLAALLSSLASLVLFIVFTLGCAGCGDDDSVSDAEEAFEHHQVSPGHAGGLSQHPSEHQSIYQTKYPNADTKPIGQFVTQIDLSEDAVPGTTSPALIPVQQSAYNNAPIAPIRPEYNAPYNNAPVYGHNNAPVYGQHPGVSPPDMMNPGVARPSSQHGPVVLLNNPGAALPFNSGSVAPATLSSGAMGAQPSGQGSLVVPKHLLVSSQSLMAPPPGAGTGGAPAFPPALRPIPDVGLQGGAPGAVTGGVPVFPHALRPIPDVGPQGGGPGGLFDVPALRPVPQVERDTYDSAGLFQVPHLRPVPQTSVPVSTSPPDLGTSARAEIDQITPMFNAPNMSQTNPPTAPEIERSSGVRFAHFDAVATIGRVTNRSLNEKEMGAQEEITYAPLDLFRREQP